MDFWRDQSRHLVNRSLKEYRTDKNSCVLELLRENKRMLDKSIREIDRERQGLQTQEKKLILEIKKSAKQGQMVCHMTLLLHLYFSSSTKACLYMFVLLWLTSVSNFIIGWACH